MRPPRTPRSASARDARGGRRAFLAWTGGAAFAAAIAPPAILPGAARAARAGGAERFPVAVLGATGRGNYGHDLDRVWLEIDGADIAAVADADPAGREAARKRLGARAAYADYREMLEKERPRIVSVAPRWLDQHCAMVEACAAAGAHIFLEKPMCRDLEEADRMSAACARAGVKLVIAHQTRASPRIEIVRRLIAGGEIGDVVELRGRGKEDARRGGGEDLWVLGSHVLDLMRLLGGDPSWCFARILEGGRRIAASDVVEGGEGIGPLAGDRVDALFGLPGGVAGHFASRRGAEAEPSRFGLTVLGTKGVIEITRMGYLPDVKLLRDASWSPGRTQAAWIDVTSAGPGVPEPLADGGLLAGNVLLVRGLLEAIEKGTEPPSGIRDAVASTEMIVACFESEVSGGPVRIPLERRGHPLRRLRG